MDRLEGREREAEIHATKISVQKNGKGFDPAIEREREGAWK